MYYAYTKTENLTRFMRDLISTGLLVELLEDDPDDPKSYQVRVSHPDAEEIKYRLGDALVICSEDMTVRWKGFELRVDEEDECLLLKDGKPVSLEEYEEIGTVMWEHLTRWLDE